MLGDLVNHSSTSMKELFKMTFIAILKEQEAHFQNSSVSSLGTEQA